MRQALVQVGQSLPSLSGGNMGTFLAVGKIFLFKETQVATI